MIIDKMTKYEVMCTLRKDFDLEVLPYYNSNLRLKFEPIIKSRSEREKSVINLGWETITTKNLVKFSILIRGDRNGDKPQFLSEFTWQGKQCYSLFYQEGIVIVFQQHCLERYAERVLNKNVDLKNIMYKYVTKKIESAFTIVLPTPTHKYSWYLVSSDALFLGDFIVPKNESEKEFSGRWFNTCLSLANTRYTQEGIMKTLQSMQELVKTLGYSPLKEKQRFEFEKRSLLKQNVMAERLKVYFENAFMMYQLHLSFDFNFTKELYIDEIKSIMDYITLVLKEDFSVSTASLSPYGKAKGIALKGEINFIESD